MNEILVRELIQESFDSLLESGMIEQHVEASDETVLIGARSAFDSVAFVTLFMDLEDRIRIKANKEIFLILTDIHDFNVGNTALTVRVIIDYIMKALN
jgi:acyl carrier protein